MSLSTNLYNQQGWATPDSNYRLCFVRQRYEQYDQPWPRDSARLRPP